MQRSLLPGFITILVLTAPVASQTVRGRVIDSESALPIAFATLTLLRADGTAERQVFADSLGEFAMVARQAGLYRVYAERIGYTSTTTEPFLMRAREGVQVEVRLQVRGIALEPLYVVGRGGERGRDALARRQALGKGYFLTPDSLAIRNPDFPTDAFRGVPKISVEWNGSQGMNIRSWAGWGCFAVLIDRHQRPFAFWQAPSNVLRPRPRRLGLARPMRERLGLSGGGASALDERLAAEDIIAIEIYPASEDVPRELLNVEQMASRLDVEGGRRVNGSLGRCGIAIVWTKQAW